MNVSYMQRTTKAHAHTYTVEPFYCGHHGNTTACPSYRGIRILEASGVFLVGIIMHTHAVERYEGAF